jgi:hypothetical protein
MNQPLRGCRAHGYRQWERRLELAGENDRRVLAAALDYVTVLIAALDTSEFPPGVLQPFDGAAVAPDTFVYHFRENGIAVAAAGEHRASLRRPPRSLTESLHALRRNGLPGTAVALTGDQI